jgi:hypothetical protein
MPPKRKGKPSKGKPSASKAAAQAAAASTTGKPGEHSQDLPPRESKLLRDISVRVFVPCAQRADLCGGGMGRLKATTCVWASSFCRLPINCCAIGV